MHISHTYHPCSHYPFITNMLRHEYRCHPYTHNVLERIIALWLWKASCILLAFVANINPSEMNIIEPCVELTMLVCLSTRFMCVNGPLSPNVDIFFISIVSKKSRNLCIYILSLFKVMKGGKNGKNHSPTKLHKRTIHHLLINQMLMPCASPIYHQCELVFLWYSCFV